MIHSASPTVASLIDPLGQPTVVVGRNHCFLTCLPSVRPHFSKSSKTKQGIKTIFATGYTATLPEWIIDAICLVRFAFVRSIFQNGKRYVN